VNGPGGPRIGIPDPGCHEEKALSQSSSQRKIFAAAGLVAVVAAGATLLWLEQRGIPKRFGVVEEGRLYRCGDIVPSELEHVTRTYGLRTVLSLLNPDVPESIAERDAAQRLGLRWINVPLPGDGASTPEQRTQIKAVLLDPRAAPILVHCAAGANRTGLAVGIYRLHQNGWTVERVLEEMRDYAFEDLPKHQNLRDALAAERRAVRAAAPPATQLDRP